MRKVLLATLLGLTVACNMGCPMPGYSGDPVRRTQELTWTSEDLRHVLDDWERFWMLDMPSHLTPYRTHGGVM